MFSNLTQRIWVYLLLAFSTTQCGDKPSYRPESPPPAFSANQEGEKPHNSDDDDDGHDDDGHDDNHKPTPTPTPTPTPVDPPVTQKDCREVFDENFSEEIRTATCQFCHTQNSDLVYWSATDNENNFLNFKQRYADNPDGAMIWFGEETPHTGGPNAKIADMNMLMPFYEACQ